MPMYDFMCPACDKVFEEVTPFNVETLTCVCGAPAHRVFMKCPVVLTAIIPDYPGCKKHRAGYVHSHGDRPATKTMVQGTSFK